MTATAPDMKRAQGMPGEGLAHGPGGASALMFSATSTR
jgi:hypothetical protein